MRRVSGGESAGGNGIYRDAGGRALLVRTAIVAANRLREALRATTRK
jgi:hypothetical protein